VFTLTISLPNESLVYKLTYLERLDGKKKDNDVLCAPFQSSSIKLVTTDHIINTFASSVKDGSTIKWMVYFIIIRIYH
jgi:hypothetical protein